MLPRMRDPPNKRTGTMNKVMLLMLAVALTACGPNLLKPWTRSLPIPSASRRSSANAKRIARRSATNFVYVQQKPPTGASSVIGLSKIPSNSFTVASLRRSSLCYLTTPHRARVCGVAIALAPARNLAFSALIPAITVFDRH